MVKNLYSYQQHNLQKILRRIRLDAKLKQSDLAKRLDVPQSFVSKYESGERNLDFLEVRQVCAAVGISFLDFVSMFEDSLG